MFLVKKKIEELFGNVEIIVKSKGYYILKSIKGWFWNGILI